MNIAIFADLHGRLLLCFKLCARWQHTTGQTIDLILQAGDLGAFPDRSRLDRATVKFARDDPTELGFSQHFAQPQPEVQAVLTQTTCPLIFVRGNHEDHPWLDTLEQQSNQALFPIDAYQRVFCLKTGVPYTHQVGTQAVTILGIGRIAPRSVVVGKGKYIQPYERERLAHLGPVPIDILLTHDSAADFVTPGYGLSEIRQVLATYQPAYHFYGHTGQPLNIRPYTNNLTTACKLTDLYWDTSHPAKPLLLGGMGILHWQNQQAHSFEVVDAAWWEEYTAYSWEHL